MAAVRASIRGMVTRIAIITLWIVSIGWGYSFLSFLFGTSATFILLGAGVASAVVGLTRVASSWQDAQPAVEPTPAVASSGPVPVRSSF